MHPTRRRRLAVLVVLLLAPALAPPVVADVPRWSLALAAAEEEDGALVVRLHAGADAPTAVAVELVLHVNHTAPDGAADAWRETKAADVRPDAVLEARLAASRGPGTYVVDVAAPGATTVQGVVWHAADPTPAEGGVVVDVADAPTLLAWTSDGVNDGGKTKAPGDALIARVRLTDENGLDDVASLEFLHLRVTAAGHVPVARTVLTALDGGNASVTTRVLEHRFALAPLAAGAYVENVTARSRAGATVSLERAFQVSNVKPALLSATALAPSPVVPDEARVLDAVAVVGDRNFGTGPLDASSVAGLGVLTARLFRGSVALTDGYAVELAGVAAPLDLTHVGHRDAATWRVVDGHGAVDVPVRVILPAGAPSGDYRVSLYHADAPSAAPTLLGALPFGVRDLPRVAGVALDPPVATPGSRVAVSWTLAGGPADGVTVTLWRLRDGEWTRVGEPVEAAADAGVTLVVPAALPAGEYRVEVAPHPATPDAAQRTTLRLDAGPPRLALVGPLGASRLAVGPLGGSLHLALRAENFSLDDAGFTWTLVDARGVAVAAPVAEDGAGGLALDARGLAPGRYRLRGVAATPGGGAVAEATLDVGAWLAVELRGPTAALAPTPNGRLAAALPVAAVGNAPVRALVVRVEPPPGWPGAAQGEVALVDAAGVVRATAPLARGAATLDGPLLAPGEDGALLRVTLQRPAGLDAGRLEVRVAVHVARGATAP